MKMKGMGIPLVLIKDNGIRIPALAVQDGGGSGHTAAFVHGLFSQQLCRLKWAWGKKISFFQAAPRALLPPALPDCPPARNREGKGGGRESLFLLSSQGRLWAFQEMNSIPLVLLDLFFWGLYGEKEG